MWWNVVISRGRSSGVTLGQVFADNAEAARREAIRQYWQSIQGANSLSVHQT